MKTTFLIAFARPGPWMLLSVLAGCVEYHAKPLDPAAVDLALEQPSDDVLRVQAASIAHPILKPLAFDMSDGLSPDEAAVLAVLVNPTLRAERDKVGVADAQLLQAGILPNPQLTVALDQPVGGTTEGTVTGSGLGLDYDISALITRDADLEAARKEKASVALDLAWMEWQVAEEAKLHAVRVIWLQRELEEASAAESVTSRNAAAMRTAMQQGMITQVDADTAEAEWQRFHLTTLEAQSALESERLALNLAIGLKAATSVTIQSGEPFAPFPPSTPEELAKSLDEHRLDLIALRLGYDSQEAHVHSAVLSQFPKISIGVAGARDTGNVYSFGPSVTLDIPVFDRAQGSIAIETATRQQLFDEYIARSFEARSDVARLQSELATLAPRIEATDTYVARLQALQQTYSNAVRSGDADILNLQQLNNTLADTKLDALRLRAEQAELLIGLEVAMGQTLPSAQP